MKFNDNDQKWDELIYELKQTDHTVNKSLTVNYQNRKKK
jgi:hypothetical protein